MKKWMVGALGALTMLMLLPVTSQAATVKYLKVSVIKAQLWPVTQNKSGKTVYWDNLVGMGVGTFAVKDFPSFDPKKPYADYAKNAAFAKICDGKNKRSPDAFVVLKLGSKTFTTDKFNNQCAPEFKKGGSYISFTTQLMNDGKMPFSVEVRDNDGAAGIRLASQLMASYQAGAIPAALLAGKELTLNFGAGTGVVSLVLKGEVITKTVSDGCDGTYKVTVKSFDVKQTKSNGKTWDNKWLTGGGGRPDVSVNFSTGGTTIQTKAYKNPFAASYSKDHNNSSSAVVVKKDSIVKLTVYDDELRSKETIGETAIGDACKIFKGASGTYTFSNFGRVNNVVITFVKKN